MWSMVRDKGGSGWREAYVSEKKMEKRVYSFTQTEVKVCCPYRDLEGGQAFKEERDLWGIWAVSGLSAVADWLLSRERKKIW